MERCPRVFYAKASECKFQAHLAVLVAALGGISAAPSMDQADSLAKYVVTSQTALKQGGAIVPPGSTKTTGGPTLH
jgi:hypothetical protein